MFSSSSDPTPRSSSLAENLPPPAELADPAALVDPAAETCFLVVVERALSAERALDVESSDESITLKSSSLDGRTDDGREESGLEVISDRFCPSEGVEVGLKKKSKLYE